MISYIKIEKIVYNYFKEIDIIDIIILFIFKI